MEERILFFSVIIFLFGLCWGSFFNVCIWRIPRKESVVFTPSHCPKCQKRIRWFDNIPLLSYVILGGKCRSCKTVISPRYFLIELLTGFLFVIAYQRVIFLDINLSSLIMYLLAASAALLAFVIDIEHKIIPDKINYTVIFLALITAFVFPESVGKGSRLEGLLNSFLGILTPIVILGVFSIIGRKIFRKEVLGWGDIKYIGAMGACFGLIPAVWFFTLFIGSIAGMIIGFFLMLFAKKSILAEVPFGPFLAIGTFSWIIYGPELTNGYFALIGSFAL